jgi:hypothetical protein
LKVLLDEDVPRKLVQALPRHGTHIHRISAAVDEARPGTIKTIDCGVFIPRSKRLRD